MRGVRRDGKPRQYTACLTRYRRIIDLWLRDWSYREIARAMGLRHPKSGTISRALRWYKSTL